MPEFIKIVKTVLTDRQLDVVSCRFGFYTNPETRRSIAKRQSCSVGRVKVIEKRALRRLRNALVGRSDLRDELAAIFRAQALEVAR